ncbi:MAG: hypothetical protein NTV33_13440 [Coprothermobacterota bacterium]|nr:hypothetical protein [Coprothermobacterota bacterium]
MWDSWRIFSAQGRDWCTFLHRQASDDREKSRPSLPSLLCFNQQFGDVPLITPQAS